MSRGCVRSPGTSRPPIDFEERLFPWDRVICIVWRRSSLQQRWSLWPSLLRWIHGRREHGPLWWCGGSTGWLVLTPDPNQGSGLPQSVQLVNHCWRLQVDDASMTVHRSLRQRSRGKKSLAADRWVTMERKHQFVTSWVGNKFYQLFLRKIMEGV